MYLSATMRRPLRSKRAMISPVRLRANASGLTRIRVRSMQVLSGVVSGGGGRVRGARRLLGRGAAAASAAGGGRRHGAGLGLAERAQLPGGVDRLAARV